MSFFSIQSDNKVNSAPSYQQQGYGLGFQYQANAWLNSQLLVQENHTDNSHESKLNIEVGFWAQLNTHKKAVCDGYFLILLTFTTLSLTL